MGRGKSTEAVAKLVQDLQSKGFMIFLCNQVVEQAIEAGLKLRTILSPSPPVTLPRSFMR